MLGRRQTVRCLDIRFPLSAYRCCCLLNSIPNPKRGEAPLAAGFYRSWALRRTMGFPHRTGRFREIYVCRRKRSADKRKALLWAGQAKGQLWLTWRSYAGPPQPILIARRAIPPSFGPFEPGPQSGSKEPLYFPLLNYLYILYNKVSDYYKEKQHSAASFIEERRKPCILLIRMMLLW